MSAPFNLAGFETPEEAVGFLEGVLEASTEYAMVVTDAMGVILFLISLCIIVVQVGFFGRGARRDV